MSASRDQYILPFEEARNTLLSRVRALRYVDTGLNVGRIEGVCQLLERLIILSNDLTENDGLVRVKAQGNAIAGRIDGRRSVCEKTIRNWRRDAVALGVLSVEYTSQLRGGHSWNHYFIDVPQLRAWGAGQLEPISVKKPKAKTAAPEPANAPPETAVPTPSDSGGNGRKRAVTITAPRAVTITDPGAVTVTALTQRHTQRPTPPPQKTNSDTCGLQSAPDTFGGQRFAQEPETKPSAATQSTAACSKGEVEALFSNANVRTATGLIDDALRRGCSLRSLEAIYRWFERSQKANPKHWRVPENVLYMRLKNAAPGVAAWRCWPGGLARRKSKPAPRPQSDFRRVKAQRQREYVEGPTMAELYEQAMQSEKAK
jgi:hypothetical protein